MRFKLILFKIKKTLLLHQTVKIIQFFGGKNKELLNFKQIMKSLIVKADLQ